MESNRLDFNYFNTSCEQLAQNLLGTHLVSIDQGIERIGRIVETEAYLGPIDKASHSYKGNTNRTKVLFGQAGFSYVYLIYGIHKLFNITALEEGSAVLIRAVEPIKNIELKTNGPGLLTKAMGIDKEDYGLDLTTSDKLFILNAAPIGNIISRPRIGVGYAEEWADKPLRFYEAGNKFVSKL